LCHSCLKNQVETKAFPEANVFNTTHTVQLQDEEHQVKDIRGFLSCKYDKAVACVCVTSE
jgi:hypothetical protein